MESDDNIKQNEVSGPLQHLLSLKWETLPDISTVADDVQMDVQPVKQLKKKVRFSEKVEQNFVESYDIESNEDDEKYDDDFNDSVCSDSELIDDIDNSTEELNMGNNDHLQDSDELKDYHTGFEDLILDESSYDSNQETEANLHLDVPLSSLEIVDDQEHKDGMQCELSSQIENHISSNKNTLNYEDHIVKEMASIEIEENSTDLSNSDLMNKVHQAPKNIFIKNQTDTEISPNMPNPKSHIQKQTKKINCLLNNSSQEFSSVPELRSKVVEAWNTVKKKKDVISKRNENFKKDEKMISPSKPIIKDAHTLWKISKFKRKNAELSKNIKNNSSQMLPSNFQRHVSKADQEEKEMAFKSWKKHKDKLLQQEAERNYREKEEKNISLLMKEEMKKEEAESAYLTWIAHKTENYRKEQMKMRWLLQKDQEAKELKKQRDKKALEIYNMWLEHKYSQKQTFSRPVENRPPWIPPPHG